MNLFRKTLRVLALGALLPALPAMATEPLFQNLSDAYYVVPENPLPTIDATAFDNESVFSISDHSYPTATRLPVFEPGNTLYYTNGENGLMIFNGQNLSNSLATYGIVAKFENFAPLLNNNYLADTFFNQGIIRVDSLLDGNNTFTDGDFLFYYLSSLGQCTISATNIVNPGNIVIGANGRLQLNGQNVDLTRAVLSMESAIDANQGTIDSLLLGSLLLNNVNFTSSGAVGTDFFGEWNPKLYLTANTARSSYSPIPTILMLSNSASYFDVVGLGTSNVIYRAVFVENDSPNVPYNVYIDTPDTGSLGFESGAAHVEWVGPVLDPITGNYTTNYLYLTDNYVWGASTNVFVNNGVPDNYSFIASSMPLLVGPVTAGFSNVFSSISFSNPYSYMNGQILTASISTNVSVTNPSGSLTNLPARVEITASRELNLEKAIIGGQNFISIVATNQFDGSAGASISSPFADFNLGVTNGQMIISNLLSASLPNWSGSIQAWSTRWLEANTNGGTNDFRVLLVRSRLQATTVPWIKNFVLHGSTNLLISDALNVYGTVSIDAQNLTLTTNGVGNGASSADGELNWIGTGTFGPAQLPNMRCLTNNGAIRLSNLAQFISTSNSISYGPGLPAVKATGKLSKLIGANVKKGNRVIVGTNQYVFVNTLTNKLANQVKIGLNFDTSMNNLIAAINHAAGAGTKYSKATTSNALVHAGVLASHAFTVTAATAGAAGNSIMTWTSSTNLTWSGHNYLYGGADAVATTTNIISGQVPYDAFINSGLVADQGTVLTTHDFLNSGVISNGVGNFTAKTVNTTLTNGAIYAGGNISLTAATMLISNTWLQCLSLTLAPTNWIDAGLTNGNFWTVGRTNGTGGQGFALTIKPPTGDLLSTTITNICPGPNKAITNTWAGTDLGVSALGFSNNMALGRLVLTSPGSTSKFIFKGAAGVSNALYVDYLELRDATTNHSAGHPFDFPWLSINTNLIIYYAQAVMNGGSVAEAIDQSSQLGFNGGRLRWVPSYAGQFSSTNLVYPPGVTNTVNAALAQSADMDSDGDGIYNLYDPTPFFTADQINLTQTATNTPANSIVLNWFSIPNAMNYILNATNFSTGPWLPYTNFPSPVPYLAYPSAPKQLSLVVPMDINSVQQFYKVGVDARLTYPY